MHSHREILIVGLGSAGCKFIDTCSRQNDEALPKHIAMHTDQQMLDAYEAENKFLLGANLLKGDSTGGDHKLGKQAAEYDRSEISELLIGTEMLFLITGLGGGTGTGAAPLLAGWAREQGAIVICFAIQPFFFEGNSKRLQAEGGLRDLRNSCDAVIQLSNQNIYSWANDQTGVQDAFEKVNMALLHNLTATIDLLCSPGIVSNVSFSDFESMLKHSGGVCVMGYGEAEGEERVEKALAAVGSNPVLGKDNIIKTASGLIIGIIGGPDMAVFEVRKLMEHIPALARSDVHLCMGAVVRPHWKKRIGIAVFASEKWEEEENNPVPAKSEDPEAEKETQTKKRKPKQTKLTIGPRGKGFFNDVEPTYFDGNDIDVPTFQRKNIKLS